MPGYTPGLGFKFREGRERTQERDRDREREGRRKRGRERQRGAVKEGGVREHQPVYAGLHLRCGL